MHRHQLSSRPQEPLRGSRQAPRHRVLDLRWLRADEVDRPRKLHRQRSQNETSAFLHQSSAEFCSSAWLKEDCFCEEAASGFCATAAPIKQATANENRTKKLSFMRMAYPDTASCLQSSTSRLVNYRASLGATIRSERSQEEHRSLHRRICA